MSRKSICAFGVVLHLVALTAPPLTSNDVHNYLAFGELALAGKNPYLHQTLDLIEESPFAQTVSQGARQDKIPYGPVALLHGLLGASAGSRLLALLILKLMNFSMVCFVMFVAFKISEGRKHESTVGLVLFAWNPLLAWEVSGQLHNDILILLSMTLALWALQKGRIIGSVAALAVGFSAKFVVLPLLGLMLAQHIRTSFKETVLAAIAFALIVVACFLPVWEGPAILEGPRLAASADANQLSGSTSMLLFGRRDASEVQSSSRSAWFAGWDWVRKVILLTSGLALALRTKSRSDVAHQATKFYLLWIALGIDWVMPWYALWTLPFLLTTERKAHRSAIALMTAFIPWIYAPDWIEEVLVVPTLVTLWLPILVVFLVGKRVDSLESISSLDQTKRI